MFQCALRPPPLARGTGHEMYHQLGLEHIFNTSDRHPERGIARSALWAPQPDIQILVLSVARNLMSRAVKTSFWHLAGHPAQPMLQPEGKTRLRQLSLSCHLSTIFFFSTSSHRLTMGDLNTSNMFRTRAKLSDVSSESLGRIFCFVQTCCKPLLWPSALRSLSAGVRRKHRVVFLSHDRLHLLTERLADTSQPDNEGTHFRRMHHHKHSLPRQYEFADAAAGQRLRGGLSFLASACGSRVRGVCPMQEDRGNTSVAYSQFNLCT